MALTMSPRKRKHANGSIDSVAKRTKPNVQVKPGLFTSVKSTTISSPATSSHTMTSRAHSLASTRAGVFNIQELLENILVHLPVEDILTVRSVNKHWNSLITTSPKLLCELHLSSKPTKSFWACDLKTACMERFLYAQWSGFDKIWRRSHHVFVPSSVNSLFFDDQKTAIERGSLMQRAVYCESFRFKAQPDLKLAEKGSGRIAAKMMICQPPTEKVTLLVTYGIKRLPTPTQPRPRIGYNYRVIVRIENPSGITYGELLRRFLEEVNPKLQFIGTDRRRSDKEIFDNYSLQNGTNDMKKRAELLAIDVSKTKVYVRRLIFPTKEEFELVELSETGHQPSEDEVEELKGHLGAVEGFA